MLMKKLITLSAFMVSSFFTTACIANVGEVCPSGQVREIKERIVKPATYVDMLLDREVVTEGAEFITLPAEWEWVDMPADYIRPEFVEVEAIFVGISQWNMAEVEMTFQYESYDNIKKLDGSIIRRTVPAIKKMVKRRFEDNRESYFVKREKLVFDVDTMETTTQIKVPTKPSLNFTPHVRYFPDYVTDIFDITPRSTPVVTKRLDPPKVVGRIHHPADIEEYYGECVSAKP